MDLRDNQTRSAYMSHYFNMTQTLAQAVHASSDPFQIGDRAMHLLRETFPARILLLAQADAARQGLAILAQVGTPAGFPALSPGVLLPYTSYPLLFRASHERDPILLADLHHPDTDDQVSLVMPFVDQQTRGCLCLPLWCGETFEGLLIVGLASPLLLEGFEPLVFLNCGLHLASALSHARLQKRILDGRHYIQETLDQMPEGVIIAEAASGHIRYANSMAAQLLGTTLADLVNAPLHLPAQAFQQAAEHQYPRSFWTFAVIRALAGETLHQMETVVLRPDGTQLSVRCSAAPLQAGPGAFAGAILILQDMTLQKHLEHHQNAFLALASHELRTPLTAVLGYGDIMAKMLANFEVQQPDPVELRTVAGHIVHEAEHMAFLIDEMLDLSSLDQDQLTLHMGEYDLREILTRVVEVQQQATHKHQLRLTFDEQTRAHGCITAVDHARLLQTFSNLVTNAIKYSPQGGEIEIGLRQEGLPPNRVCIWVSDHGLGIDPQDLPHLFQRFYRSRKPDRANSGLGVGLYLVKQIIERHSGHVWVESTEGQGATFFTILPLF